MKAPIIRFPKFKVLLLAAGVLCANLLPAVAQTTLTNGLIGYWPFDTTDGTVTPDLALNNSMYLSNSPSLTVSGISTHNTSNCFTLSGTSFLFLAHSTNFAATGLPIYSTKGYTVAFWVKGLSSQAANHIIFCENNFNNSGLLFEFNTSSTKIRVMVKDDNNITRLSNVAATTPVFDTTGTNWHHIAWVDNNGAGKLYIDGVPDATVFNYTAAAAAPTGNILSVGALIRSSGVADQFTGSVDDVMAWSRVLSQAEIQSVMASGIPEPIAGTPPVVVNQPVSSTNSMGDRATFSANVFGSQPMSYQWLSNGVALAGQTNSSLALTSLTSPGTSMYSIMATNAYGTNTSNPASLVVLADPANNLLSGLASYWPFDSVSNSTSSPDLVSQNDMQLVNMSSANLVAGEFGEALSFDGSTQYGYETTGVPIYDLSTTYTVAFWVNGTPGTPNEQTFANGNSANGNYFFIGPDNSGSSGRVDVRINPAGLADTLSTNIAFDGTWHHIVWVDQNGKGLLYIDGVLDPAAYNYGHGALGALVLNNTTVGALNADPLRDYYAGNVDDVGTWTRRLTYSEIQAIFTSGIPKPPVIIKPTVTSLTSQPASLTSGVYQGDTVTLSVVAGGTSPFTYQWQYNNLPISGGSNPSALTNVLVLSNVQPSNSGPYSVIINNSGGSITSSVVSLTVTPYIAATNGTALQVEFNWAAGPVVQPGFSSMTLAGNPASFNGPEITLSPIGSTSLADRARTVPVNNPPGMTQADIYSQIIFSTANIPGTGIDILIQRLAPNTAYGLTMWSFDSQNTGLSDWTEVASGTPVSINGYPQGLPFYDFSGTTLPATNYDDTFGALLTSSPTGELEIQGVVDPNNSAITVFINAMRLIANPAIQITGVQVIGGNLQLTVTTQYPNQTVEFQESPDLSPGSWVSASDATITGIHGLIVTEQFPISSTQLFYRAISP